MGVRLDYRLAALALKACAPIAMTICMWFSASAVALPAERAYEQVSPKFKGGYGASSIDAAASSGNRVLFTSFGAFAGSTSDNPFQLYQADRSPSGWVTSTLNPPSSLSPSAATIVAGIDPTLTTTLWDFELGIQNTGLQINSIEQGLYKEASGGFQTDGPTIKAIDEAHISFFITGFDSHFCNVLIEGNDIPPLAGVAEAPGTVVSQLYDVESCGTSSIKLVALNNSGEPLSPECVPLLASQLGQPNSISADGGIVFFKTSVPNVPGCLSAEQLFARVGGARTLEVSKPLEEEKECAGKVPCKGAAERPSAEFAGASEDGSRVFFTTAAPLEPLGDIDKQNDLYMATIGCAPPTTTCEPGRRVVTSLTQVSHDPHLGEAADVQGVVAVSPDGSRTYFVAHGVLTSEGVNAGGAQSQPVPGADNLYVYEASAQGGSGRTVFIGDLCSGPSLSGDVSDGRCPADLDENPLQGRNDVELWSPPRQMAQTTNDGRVLVLSTYARLIDAGPQADTDNAQDVYRFDSNSGSLVRVSVGQAGAAGNGNTNDGALIGESNVENADARIQTPYTGSTSEPPGERHVLAKRAISEDGSRIVFTTAEPLSRSAANGLPDIYEWHEGAVSMISSGTGTKADETPTITPDGDNIFFVTVVGLLPLQDSDGAPDVYDARVDGGFPMAPLEPEECRGDACQGPLTNPAPLLVPGSVPQTPGENLPPPKSIVSHVKKVASKQRGHTRRRSKHGRRASGHKSAYGSRGRLSKESVRHRKGGSR